MADENSIDQRLHNEFWLNEIKVKNEALKQLLSINALLMAGYATILFNINYKAKNPSGETPVEFIINIAKSNNPLIFFSIDTQFFFKIILVLAYTLVIGALLLFLTGPIVLWLLSMDKAMASFTNLYDDTEGKLAEPSFSWKYLRDIAKEKNSVYSRCYEYTIAGVIIVTLIIVIIIFFGVFV